MTERNSEFVTSTPKELALALDKAVSSLQPEGKQFERRSLVNSLILAPSAVSEPFGQRLVDLLDHINPGRLIVLVCDDNRKEIDVSVAARCHKTSDDEWGCSEVLRIVAPAHLWEALPNLVLANLLTGASTDLYLLNSFEGKPHLAATLARLCEGIVIDSSIFDGALVRMKDLYRSARSFVDLQWLAGACWRDQIREIFSRNLVQSRLADLSAISVGCRGTGAKGLPSVGLLAAGWILDCLGLEAVGMGSAGFECRGRSLPASCSLKLSVTGSAERSQIDFIRFDFAGACPGRIVLTRDEVLETIIELGGGDAVSSEGRKMRSVRAFEDESSLALIQRYYSIGELLSEYRPALTQALELEALNHGFLGVP